MKKTCIVVLSFLLVILIGIVVVDFIYNKEDDNVKIGMVLNGRTEDKSWSQSHYVGMEMTREALKLEVFYREEVPEDERSIAVMEELIAEGCKIIICNSYSYGEYALEVAGRYPEVCFYHAAGVETSDNLSTYFGRIYQMRYLAGILAGMQTESNEIGYVAAFPISEVNRGINAFTLGVKSVNPDAEVYVEWSNSWTDEEENRKATEYLLQQYDIDVIAMHADAMSPLDVAEEKGIWSIGYNVDNSVSYPNSFLTAAIWNWEKFYTPRIQEYTLGRFAPNSYWESTKTGIVELAPFTKNVKPGIAEVVESEKNRLERGDFDVFYGPIRDVQGNMRVQKGENISDAELLYEFDWYVEGVVINEK